MSPDHLVDLAYAAAVDPDLWPEWCAAMSADFDAVGGMLFVLDTRRRQVLSADFVTDRFDVREFLSEWTELQHLDPQIPAVLSGLGGGLYRDTDHRIHDAAGYAQWVQWVRARWAVHHHVTAYNDLGRGLRGGFTLHQASGKESLNDRDLQRMQALLPDIRRAMRLAQHYADALTESFWLGTQAAAREPALLISDTGRLIRANTAAEAILRAGDAISIKFGRLSAQDADADARLQAGLALAVRSVSAQGATVSLPQRTSPGALLLSIYPIARRRQFPAADRAAALVTIIDPPTPASIDAVTRLSAACGLSRREREVLDLMLADAGAATISDRLQISRETVRVHIRNLYRKLGANSRSAVLAMLRRA